MSAINLSKLGSKRHTVSAVCLPAASCAGCTLLHAAVAASPAALDVCWTLRTNSFRQNACLFLRLTRPRLHFLRYLLLATLSMFANR